MPISALHCVSKNPSKHFSQSIQNIAKVWPWICNSNSDIFDWAISCFSGEEKWTFNFARLKIKSSHFESLFWPDATIIALTSALLDLNVVLKGVSIQPLCPYTALLRIKGQKGGGVSVWWRVAKFKNCNNWVCHKVHCSCLLCLEN